jgi:hypothetical protein
MHAYIHTYKYTQNFIYISCIERVERIEREREVCATESSLYDLHTPFPVVPVSAGRWQHVASG